MAKRKPLELNDVVQLLVERFNGTFNSMLRRGNGIKTAQTNEYLNGISASIAAFNVDTLKINQKDANEAIKWYCDYRDEISSQLDQATATLPPTSESIANYGRIKLEFRDADKAVELAKEFVKGEKKYNVTHPETGERFQASLSLLAEINKDRKRGKIVKNTLAGGLSAILGTALPLAIPEGFRKIKEEIKNFKANSKKGKWKTAGSALAGGLGVLTGSASLLALSSWGKEHANKDLQIQDNSKALRKSIANKIKESQRTTIDLYGSGGVTRHSRSRRSGMSGGGISPEDLISAITMMTSSQKAEIKTNLNFAKGGIVDIKGGAFSRLGGATVNEQGQEQAIILPAKKSPLDILVQKVTETNEILYEQLDEQQDQSRLAALARKDKDKVGFGEFKKADVPTAVAEKTGDTALETLMKGMFLKQMLGGAMSSILTSTALAIALPLITGAAMVGAVGMLWKSSKDTDEALNNLDFKKGEDRAGTHDNVKDAALKKGYSEGQAQAMATNEGLYGKSKDSAGFGALFSKEYWGGEPDAKMATGGHVLVGESGSESLKVTPKDNKDFPSGSSKNPMYVVQDDRKRRRNPDDMKLAALQTKAFSSMQSTNEEEVPLAATKADTTIGDKISSLFSSIGGGAGSTGSPSTGGKRGFLKSIFGGKEFDISKLQSGVGAVAAQFESGGRGAGTISSGHGDAGGKSYGTHQLSSKTGTLKEFLGSSGYGKSFSGMQEGGADFDAKWKELASSDPNFAKAQQDFIAKTHAAPQLAKLESMGVDTKNRAIQEMAFSTGVQYGPNSNVIADALKATGKDIKTMSVVDIINAVQDYKAGNVGNNFRSSSSAVQASVANRHGNGERQALLATERATAQPRMMAEGNVKNIKSNAKNAGEGSRLKTMEAGVDAQMQASHAQGTQQAINNISIGGSSAPIPPANITTGDNMSFATRLAKSY